MPALQQENVPDQTSLIPASEAAARLDVSKRTIQRRIADGSLPAYHVGRLVRINPADLDRLAQRISPQQGGGDAA